MSTIYVVIRMALQEDGDLAWCAAEKAFATKEGAEAWFKGKPVVWAETIDDIYCNCQRAIHPVEIEQ